jgi:uncharacterized phage protein gp47/JayE
MITIPTFAQLQTAIQSDLEAEFGATIPTFGKNFLRVLSVVLAGVLKLYYLATADVQKNIFPDTADTQANGGTLERFGLVKLNRLPFAARAGQYDVEVTGTIGATIPAQTTFKSDDDSANPGKLFILDAAFTLTATTDTITIRALEAGVDSKMFFNETLTATAPILNVNQSVRNVAEITQPLAAETTEVYRERVLDAYRLEPQGGAATDYRLWSADAQGVQRVYPYAKSGFANEINVFVEATLADSTDGKGTPSNSILNEVADVIEFDPDTTRPLNERGRRPLGVFEVHVLPVTIRNVDVQIASYVGLTASIQSTITTALTNAINEIRPFVAAADIIENKNDILDTNKIIAEILNARPGSVFGTITLEIDSTAMPTFTFQNGDIPFVNSITFV